MLELIFYLFVAVKAICTFKQIATISFDMILNKRSVVDFLRSCGSNNKPMGVVITEISSYSKAA